VSQNHKMRRDRDLETGTGGRAAEGTGLLKRKPSPAGVRMLANWCRVSAFLVPPVRFLARCCVVGVRVNRCPYRHDRPVVSQL